MTRLIFWCLIGVALYAALRKLGGGSPRGGVSGQRRERVEDMVACRVCGLNVPRSEAVPVGGQWACCAEHAREAGPQGRA
jgi:hypothetical protein